MTRSFSADSTQPPPLPAVRLLLHGAADLTRGGPSLRVPRTAQELRARGLQATATQYRHGTDIAAEIPEDLVHLFNVWPPDSALQAAGKRVVFSPTYLDFSKQPLWQVSPELPAPERARYLQDRGRLHEIVPRYHAMVREMIASADHVIVLSQAERSALAAIGADLPEARCTLIHNPVDAPAWQGGDAESF